MLNFKLHIYVLGVHVCVNLFGQTLYDVDTLIYKCTPFIIFNRVGLFICWTITCKKKTYFGCIYHFYKGKRYLRDILFLQRVPFCIHPKEKQWVVDVY